MSDVDVVEFTQGEDGDWYWHRRATNGRIVADSGEGYENRGDCENQAHRVNGPYVAYVWGGDDDAA